MEHGPWTPLEVQDVLEVGQPTSPVCPGLRRVLGCKTSRAKLGMSWANWDVSVTQSGVVWAWLAVLTALRGHVNIEVIGDVQVLHWEAL